MRAQRIILALSLGFAVSSCGTAEAFCYEEAGEMYGISPQLLWTISKGESNFNPAAVNYNSNGSYDFGLMQINSSWSPALRKIGISWDSLGDPCTNVKVGAWVVAGCIRVYGYTWSAVGCYNSRTPSKRDRYAARIAALMDRERKTIREPQRQPAQPEAGTVTGDMPWDAVFAHASR